MSTSAPRTTPAPRVALAAAAALHVALVLYGAAGVRGTDQYWYVADVESILASGRATTNEIYPLAIWRHAASLPLASLHDLLPAYLVAPLGAVIGAYPGWIACNVLLALVGAACLHRALRGLAPDGWRELVVAASLLVPVVIWQGTQMLSEAIIAALIDVALVVFLTAPRTVGAAVLAGVACGALGASRTHLALLGVAMACATVAERDRPLRTRLALAAATTVTTLALTRAWQTFHPGMVTFAPRAMLTSAPASELGNVGGAFELHPHAGTFADLTAKLAASAAIYTTPSATWAALVAPALAVAIAAAVTALTRPIPPRVAWASGALLACHVALIVLHQNQPRYLLLWLPGLWLVLGCRRDVGRSLRVAAWGALFGVVAPVDLALAHRARQESYAERADVAKLSAWLREIPRDDAVALDASVLGTTRFVRAAYALRPRYALLLSNRYDASELRELTTQVHPRWLVTTATSPLAATMRARAEPGTELDLDGTRLVLRRLAP